MSQTIDERVVEMRFDNKQFENGVKESLSTLDKLKAALDLDKSAKSFILLDKAANSVSLEGISAGVEALQNRFSTLGIVGMRVIENVTDSLMGLATKTMSYVTDAIVSGGLKRAQNIENAHFQLQALLKDEEAVQAVMANAMASVDGTAYAYDEAAKAASQFAASGLKAGEKMERALRGITGVAAMTSSEYENISSIFTTVAGNGRLMGDQLLQLSRRGLNAAATIADYFKEVKGQADMTEMTIRDLVSDGKISFETFAAAMDWAFGESAFRANETFTGAFSNLRSALARIGAEFYSPLIEQNSDLILLVNTLRERVNDVKKGLTFDEQRSAISGLTKATGIQTEALEEMFAAISENGSVSTENLYQLSKTGTNAFAALHTYINGVREGTIRATYSTTNSINELTDGMYINYARVRKLVEEGKIDLDIFTSAMEHAYGDQNALSKQFTDNVLNMAKSVSEYLQSLDLSKPLAIVYYGVESIKNATTGLLSVLQPIGKAFSDAFLTFGIDDIVTLASNLSDLTSELNLSDETSKKFYSTFSTIFSNIRLIGENLISLVSSILPPGIEILKNLLGGLYSIIKPIAAVFVEIFGNISTDNIVQLAEKIVDLTSKMRLTEEGSKNLHDALKGVLDFLKLLVVGFMAFLNAILPIETPIRSITGGILSLAGSIGRALSAFSEWAQSSPTLRSIYEGISGAIETAISSLVDFTAKLKEFVGNIISGEFSQAENKINIVSKAFETMRSVIDKVIDVIITLKDKALSKLGPIAEFIGDKAESIAKSVLDLLSKVIDKIGIENIIDLLITGTFSGLAIVISTNIKKLIGILDKGMDKGLQLHLDLGFSNLFNGIKSIVAQINTVFGNINQNLRAVKDVLVTYQEQIKADILKTIAVSILILAGAIFILSRMDLEKMIVGLGSIVILLKELTKVFNEISTSIDTSDTNMTKIVVGLLSISFAVGMLATALKKVGSLELGNLIGAGTVITAFMYVLAKSLKLLAEDENKLNVGILKVLAFAYAVKILASSAKIIGELEVDQLAAAGVAISVFMGVLTLCLKELSKDEKKLKISSFKMSAFAEAILVLAGAAKLLAGLEPDRLALSTLAIVGLMGALTLCIDFLSDSGKKFNLGVLKVLAFAGSVYILALAVRKLGELPVDVLKQGALSFASLIVAMGLFITAIDGAKSETLAKASTVMLSAAASLVILAYAFHVLEEPILAFSKMSFPEIASGVGTIAASLAAMVLALKLMPTNSMGLAASLLGLSAALLILVPVVSSFGEMKIGSLLQGVGAIAGLFLVIGGAGALLGSVAPVILALAGAIMIFGVACVTIGGGLTLFVGALTALAALGTSSVLTLVEAMQSFIAGVLNAIIDSAELFAKAAGTVIEVICKLLREYAPQLVEAVWYLIRDMVTQLSNNAPELTDMFLTVITVVLGLLADKAPIIVDELTRFFVGVLDSLTENLPDIVNSVVSFFKELFTQISNSLNVIDMDTYVTAIEAIGLIALIMLELTSLAVLAPGAMVGILEMGALIAELSVVLSAFGAISQKFPELRGLIDEGGDLLQGVAIAIGKFVGGLFDGVMSTISGNLPQLGSDLSSFMDNIQPFLDGASKITPQILEGVTSLTSVILLLTAADILQGLTSWITGGKASLSSFGNELAAFGISFAFFADTVKDVDMNVVEASTNAAMSLSAFANSLPDMGGLADLIFGTKKTISEFALELIPFGIALVAYSKIVSGNVDSAAIAASASAALILSAFANSLPDTGGLAGLIFGEKKTLTDFAVELIPFGHAIVEYSSIVAGKIDQAAVEASVKAAEVLAGFANTLPDTGGLAGLIFGEKKTLSEFAVELIPFGMALVIYSDTVKGKIDQGAVEASIRAAEVLAAFADTLPDTGGLVGLIFGDQKSLSEFGKELIPFGSAMADYSSTVSGKIDQDAVEASIKAAEVLSAFADTLSGHSGLLSIYFRDTNLEDFGKQLKKFGEYLAKYGEEVEGINITQLSLVNEEAKKLVLLARDVETLDTSGMKEFSKSLKEMGLNGVNDFISGFTDSVSRVQTAVDSLIDSANSQVLLSSVTLLATSRSVGESISTSMKDGIEGKKSLVTLSIQNLGTSIVSSMRNTITTSTFNSIGSNLPSGMTRGIESGKYNTISSATSLANTIVSRMKTTLTYGTFTSIGSTAFSGIKNGINSGKSNTVSAATTLATSVSNAVKNNLKKDDFKTIGSNIGSGLSDGINGKISDISDAAINAAKAAITAAKKKLEIKSPSRVFIEIGENVSTGLANGITNTTSLVEEAGYDLADNTINPFQDIVNKLSELLNDGIDDYDPVITPVMDLSYAEEGIARIHSMFQGLNLSTTMNLANGASAGFYRSSMNQSKINEEDKQFKEDLADFLKEQEETPRIENHNIFNIQSTDPKQAAEEIGYIMQRQVERGKAAWAK